MLLFDVHVSTVKYCQPLTFEMNKSDRNMNHVGISFIS